MVLAICIILESIIGFNGILFGIGLLYDFFIKKHIKKYIKKYTKFTKDDIFKFPLGKNVEKLYMKSEKDILKTIVKEELQKNNFDKTKTIDYIDNRKFKITIIFSILNFLFISFIFFHLPLWTYLFIFLNIIIYIIFIKKYNIESYIIKQIKARPDDNISDIVATMIQNSYVSNKFKNISIVLASIILPIFVYFKPMTFYEKYEDGYFVRFYTVGLTNYTEVDIPETHNGKKVIGIRGNVFSNMYFVKEINLPDSIEIIRGKAFKNDKTLKNIKLPENLTYLGGSAFRNCSSLEYIEIPEGVTEINGSTFEGCTNLKEVKLHDNITSIHGSAFRYCSSLEEIDLPDKITEIRGNTFEECISLKEIEIPEGVTRIGGHAFYGNSSLSKVTLTQNSRLTEIGSSAFRKCNNLLEITLPKNVYINERAFKESPTVIKYFGELNYGYLIDSSKYTYNNFQYLYVNESKKVNEYRKSAKVQDAYISLENIVKDNESYKYTLKYKENDKEEIFTLSKTEPSKIINDNLALEISAKYVLNYDNRISLNIYYN